MNPSIINIAVLHEDATARASLCDFIADAVGFRVVADAAQAADFVGLEHAPPVHVLVVHHACSAGSATEHMDSARARMPGAGVVLILPEDANALPAELVPPGAACLGEKRVGVELVGALRTIAMGRRYRPA